MRIKTDIDSKFAPHTQAHLHVHELVITNTHTTILFLIVYIPFLGFEQITSRPI